MRQIAAILLLGIFSFNLFGYRIVATYMEKRADKKMELAIDGDAYKENELVSIKMPVNLPYYTNSQQFTRVDGEVEIEGVHYKYVKRRIFNDSLEMLCIPDAGKMKIQAVKIEFSKLAADVQQSTDHKKNSPAESKSFKKALSEFEEEQASPAFKIICAQPGYFLQNSFFINTLFTKFIEQPPDHLYSKIS